MSDLTIVTASIPERHDMLVQAMESVAAQTMQVNAHVVCIDVHHRGTAITLNAAMQAVESEWVMVLDDDDLLDPDHVAVVMAAATDDVDVVYTNCRGQGGSWLGYDKQFDPFLLKNMNIVPITAAFRWHLWRGVGGYETTRDFDWRFWQRLLEERARFKKLDDVTWTYRFHGANQSREGIRHRKVG